MTYVKRFFVDVFDNQAGTEISIYFWNVLSEKMFLLQFFVLTYNSHIFAIFTCKLFMTMH